MAPYESDDSTTGAGTDDRRAGRRKKAARYIVPVAVTGVAAATIGLVPAIADSGSPDLPEISAEQLIQRIAESDTEQLSGTVKITTDLGLPNLGGLESGLLSGATGSGGDGSGSSADPQSKLTALAAGTHTLRVAVDGPDRQKLSLLENAAEYSVIHNGDDVWGYDSASNEVYHSAAAEDAESGADVPATPKDFAEQTLKAVDDTTSVTVDGTAQVAGRDAYKLVVKPRQSGSTVGQITIAVDSKTYTPLKFTLTPAAGGAAVVDAGFTQVDFARPAASTFDFTPPEGAKVTEKSDLPASSGSEQPKSEEDLGKGLDGLNVLGEGWNAIAVLDGGGQGVPSGAEAGGQFGGFLDSLGDQVSGKFGEGTVFKTRLINALITDDGTVYVGAVTQDALVKAADSGQ
ncbi:DUF2092 domain-containing protein [Streptomyces sp. NPDC004610]|uniref:LolA family protein n=1 Tax=unclassified Streptomyces TaxID=2593676 RepID=UPI0033BBA1D7